jgi:hypothetical protein
MAASLVPPAKGLTQLTWAQVEELDAKIRSLCVYTEATGQEIHLPIIIRNGKPIKIGEPMSIKKFSPTRS